MDKQAEAWRGDIGPDYTKRNKMTADTYEKLCKSRYGFTRTEINADMLRDVSKNARFLELGCNIGNQLAILKKMGYANVEGVDIQQDAVDIARKNGHIANQSDIFELDYLPSGYRDVVFTPGVLIHINPEKYERIVDEMIRLSARWIWCFEYWNETLQAIPYLDRNDLLWKTDFRKLFLDRENVNEIASRKLIRLDDGYTDMTFLMEKT